MNLAVAPAFSAHRGESSEAYPHVVARLTPKLRVIDDHSLHWILQVRKSLTRWESFAYCATKEGLLLRIKEHWQQTFHRKEREISPLAQLVEMHCDPAAWAAIEALPAYYPKAQTAQPIAPQD